MELTMSSIEDYIEGGHYTSSGDMTWRMTTEQMEMPLVFSYRATGNWELHDSSIIIKMEDTKMIPADEFTSNLLNESPDLKEMMEPLNGEVSKIRIISINQHSMQCTNQDFGDMIVSSNKK